MIQSPVLNVMIRAARQTGPLALRHFDRREQLVIQNKGKEGDLVSNADIEVETALLDQLQKAYPKYGILAEESTTHKPAEDWFWIVDPIDGTLNYLNGIHHFAFSIALFGEGKVQAGVVFDPIHDELFAAERGRGAFLNDHRLRVNPTKPLNEALLATGFPFRNKQHLEAYLLSFRSIYGGCREVRRLGCASLDLAYTAAGRFDGFWEMGLSPWDIAAGSLLVQEAGGYMTDFKGEGAFLETGNVLASIPALHKPLLELLQPCPFPDTPIHMGEYKAGAIRKSRR